MFKFGHTRLDGFRFARYYNRATKDGGNKICQEWASPIRWAEKHQRLYENSPIVRTLEERKQRRLEMERRRRAANKEKFLAYDRDWKAANRERVNFLARERRRKNPEKHKAASKAYALKNKQKKSEQFRAWRLKNKAVCAARSVARKKFYVRQLRQLTERQLAVMESVYQASRRITGCIGVEFHVDHIVPISRGGSHAPNNIQLMPARLNIQKKDKFWPRLYAVELQAA
jgi:hypothetical protein